MGTRLLIRLRLMISAGQWQALVVAFVSLIIGGCSGWRQVSVSPSVLDQEHAMIRLTLPDGERAVLSDPRLVRDSIVGMIHGHDTTIALSDVQRMALREPNPEQTAAAGTFWIAALVTLVAVWGVLILVNQ